ncbi:porin family protein [Granulicella paludicola]|uniref:TonB-dependent receptor n=1 Tax=Granulicella paludicola TaxID=474951 RepID=UPI0021DFC790|nr:TonB-dependent receptor [Granulicella paludicola]
MLRARVGWGVGGVRLTGCFFVLLFAVKANGQKKPAIQSAPVISTEQQSSEVDMGLPLLDDAVESLQALDSQANDAALAGRTIGDADEEQQAQRSTVRDGSAASELSYGGLPTTLNEATLDGLSVRQSFRAGPRGGAAEGARGDSIYNLRGLQGFGRGAQRDGLHMFSAQYGGAGGRTTAITRAGTPQLRGSVQWLMEASALAATNPYSVVSTYSNGVESSELVKPRGWMNQLSVTAGLPLFSAKAGWVPQRLRTNAVIFGAVDLQLHRDSVVSSPSDPQFFTLTAEQRALLGNRGVGGAATVGALDYLGSLTGTTLRGAYRLTGTVRADADVSARDQVSVSFHGNRVDAVAGTALGQASDAVVARGIGSLGDSYVNVEALSAQWIRRLTSHMENEVRGQVVHDLEYEAARAPAPQEPAISVGGLAPQVSIGPDGFAYGTPSTLGRIAYPDEQRVELADTLRWTLGRNLLTLGGDWSRMHDRIASIDAQEGAFDYDSGTTGGHDGGLVDWITDYTFNVHAYPNGGCPSINAAVHDFCFRTYTQGFGTQQTEFVTHEFAGFAEDELRVRRDLMVTMGVRYDYTLLPLPQAPNPVLDGALAAAGVTAATSRFPEDRNNVGPRMAMTWSPKRLHGATVEAGYGLFFGRVPGGTLRAALADTAMASTTEHIRITPTTIAQCPQVTTVSQGFGYPCAFTTMPPAAVAQTTSATLFAQNFRAPMVQRGSFTVSDEVARGLHVRVGYALSYGVQLPATTDVNIAPSTGLVEYVLQGGDAAGEHYPGLHTGETFVVPLYTQRRIAQYGAVTEVESNANAYMNAGTLEMEWRNVRGLSLRGSYTFSRAIDDGPLQGATPRLSSQFDPFAIGYDKGLSSLQFPQRFAGELQYVSRWQRGSARERRLLSGWRVASIATAGSGAPYSYAIFGGTRLAGGHESINGAGGATYLPTVGRNTLRLPPRGKVDMRVEREVALGGRLKIRAFAQTFNLLNERNVSGVQTRAFLLGTPATTGGLTPLVFQDAAAIATEGLTTRAFGIGTSSTTGMSRERRVEFGLRLEF